MKKPISSYEDLNVYQKAYRLALEVHKISHALPKHEQFELASQLRRASKGICANIAEGFGKQSTSKPEFKRFLVMAIGSSDEMKVWLSFCNDLHYIDNKQFTRLKTAYTDVSKMLSGLHQKWL